MTALEYAALAQVILVDIILSGDNAVVIGMAVMGLPARQRRMAMFYGIAAAVAARVVFAALAAYLLEVPALRLVGGAWLLYIAYTLCRQVQAAHAQHGSGTSLWRAIWIIAVADITMSLDNVLAVAGAANGHTVIMGVGLLLSIVFMACVSNAIANMLERHKWLVYAGVALIVYIGARMTYEGVVAFI